MQTLFSLEGVAVFPPAKQRSPQPRNEIGSFHPLAGGDLWQKWQKWLLGEQLGPIAGAASAPLGLCQPEHAAHREARQGRDEGEQNSCVVDSDPDAHPEGSDQAQGKQSLLETRGRENTSEGKEVLLAEFLSTRV